MVAIGAELNRVKLESLDGKLDSSRAIDYDLLIAVLGFEHRCTFVPNYLQGRAREVRVAAFTNRRELSFSANESWFTRRRHRIDDVPEHEFGSWFVESVAMLTHGSERAHICIDISSMSRLRIARCVEALLVRNWGTPEVTVDFLYAPARYSKPGLQGPIVVADPVIPGFAGWAIEPEKPVFALLGLGTEPEKAIGVLDFLDVGAVWLFVPTGIDYRYDRDVSKSNASLFEIVPFPNVVKYSVLRPFETLRVMESLLYGVLPSSRPVLIPLGPKILALDALVCAALHQPNVPVWRVSSAEYQEPRDRFASGSLCGLRVTFVRP